MTVDLRDQLTEASTSMLDLATRLRADDDEHNTGIGDGLAIAACELRRILDLREPKGVGYFTKGRGAQVVERAGQYIVTIVAWQETTIRVFDNHVDAQIDARPYQPGVEPVSPLPGVRKGATFEQAVADFLGTERRVQRGNVDRGDLVHPTWTLELFAPGRGKALNLSQKMGEAKVEAVNAGTPDRYAVIVRRTGYPVGEAFFCMPLALAQEVLGL